MIFAAELATMINQDELELEVSKLFKMNKPGALNLASGQSTRIKVLVEVSDWYTMADSLFNSIPQDLSINLERETPMLLMYFQLKGNSICSRLGKIPIPTQSHSLSFMPGFVSTFRIPKENSSQHLAIRINPGALIQHWSSQGIDEKILQSFLPKDETPFSRSATSISPALQLGIHELMNNPYRGQMGKLYRDNAVERLLIHQLASLHPGWNANLKNNEDIVRRDIDLLHDIKSYLDENYLDIQSLQQLSRLFCINTFKLKSGFKKLFETSVMKYIDDLKMQHARNLLMQDTPVIDIADALGYQHYNNFSTAFKRKFGYSPVLAKAM